MPASLPFRGAHVVLTLAEVARVRDALHGHRDDVARVIAAKCDSALALVSGVGQRSQPGRRVRQRGHTRRRRVDRGQASRRSRGRMTAATVDAKLERYAAFLRAKARTT